jgi:predicted phosphodiesterase
MPQGAVAGAMQRYVDTNDITAILTTGDNFYSDDFEFLMQPFGWATDGRIPFWITWGNHDVESVTRIAGIDETFGSPPRWTVYEWGDVDVVILDSTQVTSPQQAAFFLDAMNDSIRPTIVVLHHPPYSCSHTEEGIEFIDQWIGLLDDDVALVLSGHDHSYQRFEQDGVVYVVTGGGGSPLHELQECPANHPELLDGAALHHFLTLTRTTETIELTAIDINGAVIDQTSIATG